ncbi:MAG TPA: hypothetical protein VNO17_10035 [Actinomycetota bacterium]|nr:hypothetical protein [Actinomycetota bacterium]
MGRLALAAVALALLAAACGARTEGSAGPRASGALGVVTGADARRIVEGLCRLLGPAGADREEANAAFYDLAHDGLHRLAAAAQPVDPGAAGALLVAKERVEEDLGREELPPTLGRDAEALLAATREALRVVGLPAPDCPA